ncbi:hypothetical protein BGY98DRAFT_750688 [Russula aff. rugulosa BPL654]|nr:hypothetical protein BGY98DRAFT_750688 [Russula aff. rugulosa BPL654]
MDSFWFVLLLFFYDFNADHVLSTRYLGLHRDDGSGTRLIAASPPDDSDKRTDEQAETCTLNSFAPSEIATSKGNRPHPVPRASIPPTDDPSTCCIAPRRR